MRISIEIELGKDRIDKDKNRIIMHIVKLLMEKSSEDIYRELYVDKVPSPKDLNFSVYMGRGVKFLRDEILVPDRKLIVNFSTYNPAVGIALYNSFIEHEGLEIPIKDNIFMIDRVILHRQRAIRSDKVLFKTASPIVVREHRGDNKGTYYHDLSDERGQRIFLDNMKYQIKDQFPDIEDSVLDAIEIRIIENRLVKVKNYGVIIPSNLTAIELSSETYILEYLYLSGIGGRRSQGFGQVNIVE